MAPVQPVKVPATSTGYPAAPKAFRQDGPFWRVLILGALLVVIAMALDVGLGRPIDVSTPTAASGVLVVAGAIAVAIERLLEFFWSLVDQIATNPSAPFEGEAARLEDFANQLRQLVTPALTQAQKFLANVDPAAQNAGVEYDSFKAKAAAAQSIVDAMVNAKNPNAGGGLKTLKKGLDELAATLAHPQARASVVAAADAVDGLNNLVRSVGDDPGRRILSLYAGVIMGLISAGVLGLDVIHAALGVPTKSISLWGSGSIAAWWNAGFAAWPWGLLATGVAIGLGSNPLHELIKGLQKWKASVTAQPN